MGDAPSRHLPPRPWWTSFCRKMPRWRPGVKQQLQADAKRLLGLRLLDGRFMVIKHAMGLPRGRDKKAGYVSAFVEEMKAFGFVETALARHALQGAARPLRWARF